MSRRGPHPSRPNSLAEVFPVKITAKSGSGDAALYSFSEVWREPSGWAVKSGGRYGATTESPGRALPGVSFTTNDYALCRFAVASAGSDSGTWELFPLPAPLTVEESDGSPSYPDIGTLQFNADDFVVTQPVAGTALVSLKPPCPAPGAPTGLTATPGDSQVALNWTAPAGIAPTSYAIWYSTSSDLSSPTKITGITATHYTVSGLTNGTTYYFAVYSVECGSASALTSATPGTPAAGPTTYSAPGTYTFVATATSHVVECYAAGGGAATGTGGGGTGFAGGGGGEYRKSTVSGLTIGAGYPVVVGAGGAPNFGGGNSSFDTTVVVANGGAPGSGGVGGGGGAGGTGTTGHNGSNGGASIAGASGGGGGGGSGGSTGAGGAGGNAAGPTGGTAGTAGSGGGGAGGAGGNNAANGNNGAAPGGGGGGKGAGGATNGSGADGKVVIS